MDGITLYVLYIFLPQNSRVLITRRNGGMKFYKSKVELELYRWSWSYIGGSGAKSIGLGATQEPNGWSH